MADFGSHTLSLAPLEVVSPKLPGGGWEGVALGGHSSRGLYCQSSLDGGQRFWEMATLSEMTSKVSRISLYLSML